MLCFRIVKLDHKIWIQTFSFECLHQLQNIILLYYTFNTLLYYTFNTFLYYTFNTLLIVVNQFVLMDREDKLEIHLIVFFYLFLLFV